MSEPNAESVPLDPIFGTSIGRTVSRIVGDALRENTAEAWGNAAQQLWGIASLVTTIRQPPAIWGLHTTIALSNEISRCQGMADDPEQRAWWAADRAQIDRSGAESHD